MSKDLEDLVEFLHHGNTQIRQVAAETLVGYSTSTPDLFKRKQLEPIRDLKLLIKDYEPIAKNATTILVNLSTDPDILTSLTEDEPFIGTLLARLSSATPSLAELLSMLVPNLTKSRHFALSLLQQPRQPPSPTSASPAIDHLLTLFLRDDRSGPAAPAPAAADDKSRAPSYDYLAYAFADLAALPEGRAHLLRARRRGGHPDDTSSSKAGANEASTSEVALSKLVVFTEHASAVRRRGVASAIKNACFDVDAHAMLLDPGGPVNLLPYLLLPLMGPEEYSDEDGEGLPDECQLLEAGKRREGELDVLATHLETLLLLCSTRPGRDVLRAKKVYPVVREVHLQVEDEGVREGVDRLVQVLMREEEGEREEEGIKEVEGGTKVQEVDEEDELVEVL